MSIIYQLSSKKIAIAILAVSSLTNIVGCKTRTEPNSSHLANQNPMLTTAELKALVVVANQDWNRADVRMAWLSLASRFLQHVDEARVQIEKLNQKGKGGSLNLDSNPFAAGPSIDEQKLALQAAESASRSALDQQRLMMDYDKMSNDYSLRNAELFKGWDAQKFDQGIKAASAEVDNQGKRIQNFQQLIEAKKKIIENGILANYARAFNSYVQVFHEYTSAMTAVMKGASRVSRSAGVLATSILEHDKRVRHCTSALTRQQNRNHVDAIRNLKLADYSTLSLRIEKNLHDRVQMLSDSPQGKECLEYGLIQANLDDFPSSLPAEAYSLSSSVFRMKLDMTPAQALANRTLIACPAVDLKNDTLRLSKHTDQIAKLIEGYKETASSLTSINDAATGNPSNTLGENSPQTKIGDLFDADSKSDISISSVIEQQRTDGKELLLPYPATPLQAVQQVVRGGIEFDGVQDQKTYCDLRATDPKAKARHLDYVNAVRTIENQRFVRVKKDLELFGVKFDSSGKVELNQAIYKPSSSISTDPDKLNDTVRRGFFYAQQCSLRASEKLNEAAKTAGSTALTMPTPTEVSIGAIKYSFFYPPYSLGDDATTLENELTKVTRHCVDNALGQLAKSQQALGVASEFQKYFTDASNLKAPASPIPYIPNPATGTQIYTR